MTAATPLVAADAYQYSTIAALLAGGYDGQLKIAKLLEQGDLGLGTLDGVDGELVIFDGKAWQVRTDGNAYAVDGARETPFAIVTRFTPEQSFAVPAGLDMAAVLALVDHKAGGADKVVALRLDGTLATLKSRSVAGQSRPFRSLAEVIKTDQVTFDLTAIAGSAVGFRFPAAATGANVPGWHLHFMGEAKGGHVFGFTTGKGVVAHVQMLDGIRATFPAEAQSGTDAALEAVEKGRR